MNSNLNKRNTNVVIMMSLLSLSSNVDVDCTSGIPIPAQNHKQNFTIQASPFDDFSNSNILNPTSISQNDILNDFLSKFIGGTKDIDLEFAQIIDENFMSLLDNE